MRYIIILYIRDNMRKSRVNKGGIGLLRKIVPHRIKAQSGLTWLIRLLLWCCAVWSVRKRNVRFGQAEMRRAHSLSSVRLSRKTTEMANNINWIYRGVPIDAPRGALCYMLLKRKKMKNSNSRNGLFFSVKRWMKNSDGWSSMSRVRMFLRRWWENSGVELGLNRIDPNFSFVKDQLWM